jgi:serine/threonine-protein kinase PpkA
MTATPDELPTAPPGDDAPMPQIPGYRLLRVLGYGGMSTVYLAEQESLGRQVAVKVMLPEALADEVSRRRFENEARTVARLEHPHIVGIFAVGRTTDDLPWYAMPCLPRGHLGHRRFHEDPDGEAVITAILRALLSALDYAHARGVVHRDVKAENVLFDDAGRPLLADFGIALRKGFGPRVTTAGLAVGSTAYMAPEQARGEEVDGRADLYSVGVLAWEMLTGQLPFAAGDALSMAVMHAQDPIPKLPPGLRHWQRFIDRAMSKSPGHRFRDAGQMLEALERIRQRRPVPGWAAVKRMGNRIGPPQRWPRWAWGAMVLVAAATIGMALRHAGPGEPDLSLAAPVAPGAAGIGDIPAPSNSEPPTPGEQAPSPAQGLLDAAARQVAQRNLTLPEGGNAYDSVLAAHQADPEHPQLAETTDAVIAALGAELSRHLRGGNQRRATDYFERAATLAGRTGRGDGTAMRKLRADALAAIEARIADAARRFDRSGAQAVAGQAGEYGADAATVVRLRARADAILQPGDRLPGDPADAVLVRGSTGLFAASPREVSRADYGRFVAATSRPASLCRERMSPLRIVAPRSWTSPGFPQGSSEPVVCVSWSDADAYARWFSQRSGHRYRIPSAGEWQALSGIALGSPRSVAEWLQSCSQGCRQRIVAGGSWRNSSGSEPREADRGYDDVGFRLVRDL